MATHASIDNNGLTLKEKKFVDEYVKCGVATEALRRSDNIDPNKNVSTVTSRATHILSKPRVKNAILEALERKNMDDNFVADSLKTQIVSGLGVNANAATANKALELLLRIREKALEGKENSKQGGLNVNIFQDFSNLDSRKLMKKRENYKNFFDGIIEEAEEA